MNSKAILVSAATTLAVLAVLKMVGPNKFTTYFRP